MVQPVSRRAWQWAHDLDLVDREWPKLGKALKLKIKPTCKRPFTDREVAAILGWAAEYQSGRWLPVFKLLADTGARVSAVLSLRSRDLRKSGDGTVVTFQTQWIKGANGSWRPLKTNRVRSLTLPVETAACLPEPNDHGLLFPNVRDPRRPARPETIRDVLRRAFRAIGITDPQNLDIHSLRRAWITTADREGISTGIAMKISGHQDMNNFKGYQKNARGDDPHIAAVQKVHDARTRAGQPRLRSCPHSSPPSAPPAGGEEDSLYAASRPNQDLTL